MKTYFVHDRNTDADYIVIPGRTVLKATPKVLADFLYAADFSRKQTDLPPGRPEDFGEVVAVLENDQLQIRNSDLWAERRESLEW